MSIQPLCVFAGIIIFVQAAVSSADTERSRVEFGLTADRTVAVGPGMDARGKNIRGTRFYGQDLQKSNFDLCDLKDVKFYRCKLSGSSFRRARLTDASMDQCKIEGCDFRGAVVNGFDGILLAEQLTSTWSYKTKDLSNCKIRRQPGAVNLAFNGANLFRAILVSSDYTDCDFTDARIEEASLMGTYDFSQIASTASYKKRSLFGVTICAKIDGPVSFRDINLASARIVTVPKGTAAFENAFVAGSRLDGITAEQLKMTRSFRLGNLNAITFWQTDLRGLNLENQNLTRVKFVRCDLTGVDFSNAVISAAEFDGCTGLSENQIKSTWNYKAERMADVRLPDDLQSVQATADD